MRWMDADGNGSIDATEFLREFWKFGKLEHMRRDAESRRRARAVARKARAHKADWMTRFTHVTPATVTPTFTTSDFEDAERVMANEAADHDTGSIHARWVREVFEGAPMTAADFAEALRRNFHVTLTPPQLAALVGTYDDDGNGLVDGAEFYRYFVRLGRRERQRRLDQSRAERADRVGRALAETQNAMKRFNAKPRDVSIVYPEDVQKRRRDAKKVVWDEPGGPSSSKGRRRPRTAPARGERSAKIIAL